MTDRELLEAAAKAAGYWAAEFNCPANLPRPEWNPLTDDGDALRLAVKADIDVVQIGDVTRADYMIGIGFCTVEVPHWGDPYAATRRAIVRAAAEIGRSKE
jgi:hypothetical protein